VKSDLYACRSLLQTTLRKVEALFKHTPSYDELNALLLEVDAAYGRSDTTPGTQLLADRVLSTPDETDCQSMEEK
jgi:hypothetical protein